MQRGGAFAVVIEGVGEPLARRLSEELAIPCIGIGASPACDGQVLVSEDLLGLSGEQVPRFVERYARLDREIDEAARRFAEDARTALPRGQALLRHARVSRRSQAKTSASRSSIAWKARREVLAS